ncbi:MAG: MFS transporter [Oscillospiraceae bacterium]|nr:MFS transporter [Oscillospiraceae bacterium]
MKLNYKRTILVGLAFMAICSFWQVYDGIVPLILKNTFHVGDTVAGVIMALDNVLALFMLPLFGALSDKSKSKMGRRMPFIVGGTVLAVLCMLLIPVADNLRNLPLFFVGLGLVLFAMSTYRSPAVALMPDVTPKPLRSKGNAIINLMGAVGGIIALGAIKVMVPKSDNPSYFPLFLFTILLMVICTAVLFWKIKEPKEVAAMEKETAAIEPVTEEKTLPKNAPMDKAMRKSLILILCSVFLWFMGYNAATTAFSKYANTMWGMQGGDYAMVLMVAQIAAIFSYIPVGAISSKIGRKKTILGGITMLAVAFGAAIWFKSFSAMIFFFFALAGVGWASINVNSYPMVVEMSRGAEVGKYTGLYYTFSMTAQIITPILSGAVMQYLDYKYLFPYCTFFVIASFVTMCFVKHGDNKPQAPKSKLEAFDVDD